MADRYLPLIYPELATAVDYLPPMTPASSSRRDNRVGGTGQDLAVAAGGGRQDPAGRGGWMGPAGRCPAPMSSCAAGWRDFPFAYLDSFALSAYPAAPGVCCP